MYPIKTLSNAQVAESNHATYEDVEHLTTKLNNFMTVKGMKALRQDEIYKAILKNNNDKSSLKMLKSAYSKEHLFFPAAKTYKDTTTKVYLSGIQSACNKSEMKSFVESKTFRNFITNCISKVSSKEVKSEDLLTIYRNIVTLQSISSKVWTSLHHELKKIDPERLFKGTEHCQSAVKLLCEKTDAIIANTIRNLSTARKDHQTNLLDNIPNDFFAEICKQMAN